MLILPAVAKHEWRTPSQAQPKDQFGNENRTRFRVRARLNDGYVAWCGWFDDRDDFDAFLWALATDQLQYDRPLWRLPSPWWHPDFDQGVVYDFATVTFLAAPTGSNQTYTSPSDWNDSNNTIECLGSGATGAVTGGGANHGCGGGGGSYAAIANFSFAVPGTTTATYQIGAGATAIASTSTATTGHNGNPTWFNNATDPGAGTDNSKCGAKGGTGGAQNLAAALGGAGGVTATSWGQTKNAGGRGGNLSGATGSGGSGGGGAAGGSGAGNQGVDSSSTSANVTTNGGSGDAGVGGAAGVTLAGAGGNGTEWDGSHGSGGGGAGNSSGSPISAGAAGNYGGASAGVRPSGASMGAVPAGSQGLIVVTYTPATKGLPIFGNRRIFLPTRFR